ncbi:MAG: RNA polymerase sigma factor, partial [Chloroflexi bacterium]
MCARSIPHSSKQQGFAVRLEGVASFDSDRWEALYRRFFPDVYRAVLATVFDPEIALDAVQDAFEVGLRRPPADETNVVGWLYRVAVRRALRRRFRRPPPVLGTDYPDELERSMTRIETRTLLELLTARQRSIVVAHYFLGLRQEEIAEMFGVRRGTVGATIAHALAR